MAEHLASIYGTERDRVNCPFYYKIGACRHGERCSRLHNKPTISPTILLQNIYQNPELNTPLGTDGRPLPVDQRKVQQFFEDFYEDMFLELDKYGEIEYLNICDNLADHMVGNVYVKFLDEDAAARAAAGLQGRYYAGKPIVVEFSPVTDFKESTCRQYEEGKCNRGGFCNFMHVRSVHRDLRKQLFGKYNNNNSRLGGSTRFHDGEPPRYRDNYRSGGGGGGGGRDRRRGGGGGGGYNEYERRGRHGDDYGGGDRRRGGGGGGYRDDDRYRGGGDRRREGGGGGSSRRESSEERRARIASWNAASMGNGNGAPNMAPPHGSASPPPPPPY